MTNMTSRGKATAETSHQTRSQAGDSPDTKSEAAAVLNADSNAAEQGLLRISALEQAIITLTKQGKATQELLQKFLDQPPVIFPLSPEENRLRLPPSPPLIALPNSDVAPNHHKRPQLKPATLTAIAPKDELSLCLLAPTSAYAQRFSQTRSNRLYGQCPT